MAAASAAAAQPHVSVAVWEQAIDRAMRGDLRGLLELLLVAPVEPGPLIALPDDARLRERVVWALMKSPASKADRMLDAWTRNYGTGKPKLADLEVSAAEVQRTFGGSDAVHDLAESLGVSGDYLLRAARRKRAPRKR